MRSVVRILLPMAIVAAVVLIAIGVVQNLSAGHDVTTLTGGTQTITGGPVASQETIKELGRTAAARPSASSAAA